MRLFYALMPSAAMMDALRPLQQGVSGARWQTDAQVHLTLRFVGDVTARIADDLIAALPARPVGIPDVTLSGVGFFESKGHPNALWVRVTPKEPLAQLHRKFDRACQTARLEAERRAYLPHITVARLARSAGEIEGWRQGNAGFEAGPFAFSRLSLVESIRTDDGSAYEEIASVRVERITA